ncbi:MAG: Adenosine monophosphate-protein transferase and cysteine protease IbpA precursor [Lentisphaerae bacterium ADurb.Bin242]|nr:MAG: Adenosine monophosphate-protein transferase and cysteine protease IbpA precursor [Lentisphaerae bacterium ADurb.Bin242]
MKSIFDGLDQDIRDNLKQQLAVYWTYSSNAIEGNTLTLEETDFVIREGLTIEGKPLRDLVEARTHYNAVDVVSRMINNPSMTEEMLFDLHKTIMPDNVVDVQMPRGAWKDSTNGTYIFDDETRQAKWLEYPSPSEIPVLMSRWLKLYNESPVPVDKQSAVRLYSRLHTTFVAIHPFCEGNGRIARLVANIPVLKAGYPPILLDPVKRREYIQILSKLTHNAPRQIDFDRDYPEFENFVAACWTKSFELVAAAHELQKKRLAQPD